MTVNKRTPFDNLLDTLVAELIAMPDEQVLGNVDAMYVQTAGLSLLSSAKAVAGRRRVAAAKARLIVARATSAVPESAMSADQARRALAHVANDPRCTVAGQYLNEMSDEDVLRLFAQMGPLESQKGGQEDLGTEHPVSVRKR